MERVLSAGIAVEDFPWTTGLGGSLRARYFGPRPLVEDGSVRSRSSLLWSAGCRWEPVRGWEISAEVFNLFDAAASDVDYFYESRLPGEPEGGITDVHTHPVEPRSVRVMLRKNF